MVNGEWLLSLKYYYAESARAEFLSHYTWKCMVPTRGHRGDPPKEATCYVSVRRGGQKIVLLMLLKISLLDHSFSWLSYKVSGQYKEMILIWGVM
jgi:hypothetical protein